MKRDLPDLTDHKEAIRVLRRQHPAALDAAERLAALAEEAVRLFGEAGSTTRRARGRLLRAHGYAPNKAEWLAHHAEYVATNGPAGVCDDGVTIYVAADFTRSDSGYVPWCAHPGREAAAWDKQFGDAIAHESTRCVTVSADMGTVAITSCMSEDVIYLRNLRGDGGNLVVIGTPASRLPTGSPAREVGMFDLVMGGAVAQYDCVPHGPSVATLGAGRYRAYARDGMVLLVQDRLPDE